MAKPVVGIALLVLFGLVRFGDNLLRALGDALPPVVRSTDSALDQVPTPGVPGARSTQPHVSESVIKELPPQLDELFRLQDWEITVQEPQLLSALPSDVQEYRSVYGSMADQRTEATLQQLKRRVDQAERSHMVFSHDHALQQIRSSEGSPVVIIAHSRQRGTSLVFPDGGNMSLEALHERCYSLKKRCLVITCYGDDLNITSPVSATDAFRIWDSINAMASGQNTSVNDLIRAGNRTWRNGRLKRASMISVPGPAGGLVASMTTPDDEESDAQPAIEELE